MLTWQEIVQDYITKYSDSIRKATRPLREHFGVNYFTYHKIDETGKYTVLVDRPDWAEYYVENKIYLLDPYLRHPSVYQSGICYVENHGSQEYRSAVMKAGKKILDMDLGVTLIQKNDHYVEFFGFTANKQSSSLQSLCLNHPHLLKSFAVHFKEELNAKLAKMEEETGSLRELKGADFFCNDPIHPDVSPDTRLAYYKDLGKKFEAEKKAQRLSARERQCLKLLVQNKSAKETALILDLSFRTIEYYFENIKDKLDCLNKREVLKLAKDMDEAGLL